MEQKFFGTDAENREYRKARQIKAAEMRDQGMTYAAIGREFGVTGSQASILVYHGRNKRDKAKVHAETVATVKAAYPERNP